MVGVKDMMGVIVMLIVTIVTASADTVMSNDYLTLDIDCKDHRIKLLTQTLDPFSGVVYVQPIRSLRQGNEGPSFCKALGRGQHEISLEVGAGQCGWRRDGRKVQLDLYVQYDAHVQQVVDEKISVECDMATREGRMVKQLYTEEGMSVPVVSEMSYVVGQSMGQVEQGDKDRDNDMNIEHKSEPVNRGRMDNNQGRVVGWPVVAWRMGWGC